MTPANQQTIDQVATAGADSIARWRASKRAKRSIDYRRRMEGKTDKLSKLAPAWLAAVDRDDQADPAERNCDNLSQLDEVTA